MAKNCYMVRSLYIEGTLFFGSARVFQNIFTPELMEICPKTVRAALLGHALRLRCVGHGIS